MTREKQGWIVVFSGLGVNLSLGVLYSWGVISAALIDKLNWTATQTQIPYMVASAIFAMTMVPAGRLQDRLGPRQVLFLASFLAGAGFIFSGFSLSVAGLTVFFGVVFGLAMGFGYASPTPAAIKWFHPDHRGYITGIVVSGFGLAPVYIAPLTSFFLNRFGLAGTFFTSGALFFIIIFVLTFFINNPPADHVPIRLQKAKRKVAVPYQKDIDYNQMLKTGQFYLLWSLFFFGTFAGLLIIGQMAKIGEEQAAMQNAYLLVLAYAVFNFIGRITWGTISDYLGRSRTLFVMFLIQVVVFSSFRLMNTPLPLIIGKSLVGFTFGGMLSLFPALTADLYGLKNLGINYGIMITAWGVGGVLGPLFGGIARDITGTYFYSYLISAILSAAGAILSLMIKTPQPIEITENNPPIGEEPAKG